MSRVYGKRARRRPTQLDTAFELSPVKADPLLTFSSESDDKLEPSTSPSPVPSPLRRSTRRLVSPREKKTAAQAERNSEFDLKENEQILKPIQSADLRHPKSKNQSAIQSSEDSIDEAKRLNSFFVEAERKPSWSPNWSPKKAESTPSLEKTPSQEDIHHTKPSKAPARKLVFETPTQKKRPLSRSQTQSQGDEWDFLDEQPSKKSQGDEWDFLDTQPSKASPKRKLLTKSMLRSPAKSSQPNSQSTSGSFNSELELLEFFKSEPKDDEDIQPLNSSTPEPSSQSFQSTDLSNSPRVKRTLKTYGNQRSFLVERENLNKEEQANNLHDIDELKTNDDINEANDDDIDDENENDNTFTQDGDTPLKSISNLRAQGLNAQLQDELNFILDGIETSKSKISGLLDLSLKLFDDDFAKVIKNDGLPSLLNHINENDIVERYLLGFILCNTSEGAHNALTFDSRLINIVTLLLGDRYDVKLTKGSKNTKILFQEFQQKLDSEYNSVFFGLTLLLQNSSFVNESIYEALQRLLTEGDVPTEKCYQMILILLEKYLNSDDINETNGSNDESFDYINTILKYKYEKDLKTHTLTLKLLIVLSVKRPDVMYRPALVEKSLRICTKPIDEDLRLLYFGLLINLIEDERCFKVITEKSNVKRLQNLYSTINKTSTGYFALLIGYIYTKEPSALIKAFDRHELETIQLELQKFDSRGSQTIQSQVDTILSNFRL